MTINKAYNQTMKTRRAQRVQEAPEKAPAEIRSERTAEMIGTITAKVRTLLVNEVQKFPELRYTPQEREHLNKTLCDAIGNLIEELIPCETENEE